MSVHKHSFLQDRKGNVFLEHAVLTLPLLLIGVVLLANAALFFHAYQVVSSASASGARVAARAEDRNLVVEAVQKELLAGGLPLASPRFNPDADVGIDFRDGAFCTVRVTYHFQFPLAFHKVGLNVDETIDFTTRASFMREWD